jgi:MFS family permease
VCSKDTVPRYQLTRTSGRVQWSVAEHTLAESIWTSSLAALDQLSDPTVLTCLQIDSVTGITVASYCLGALIGCGINFAIGDMLGRRRMIWLAMGLILIGATLQTSAFTLAHLIVGRIITGELFSSELRKT